MKTITMVCLTYELDTDCIFSCSDGRRNLVMERMLDQWIVGMSFTVPASSSG